MSPVASAATIGTLVDEYRDAATAAAATVREQFSGDIVVHSQWEIAPAKQILILANSPDNWDGYGSPRISRFTVDLAIGLLGQVAGLGFDELPTPFVGPIAGGGIIFELQFGARELSFSVFPEGAIEYLKSESGEPFDEGAIRLWEVGRFRELVNWLMSSTAQVAV